MNAETVYKMLAEPNAQSFETFTIKSLYEGEYARDIIVDTEFIPAYKTLMMPSNRRVIAIPEHVSLSLAEKGLNWMVVYLTYDDAKKLRDTLNRKLNCFCCKY